MLVLFRVLVLGPEYDDEGKGKGEGGASGFGLATLTHRALVSEFCVIIR